LRYEGNIFRPFSEANSYLLQCTIGCSHNQCTFCGMYKDKKYRVRQLSEIMEDIKMAKITTVIWKRYFCAMAMPLPWKRYAAGNNKKALSDISITASCGQLRWPQSTLSKSIEELRMLRAAGLTKAYIGVETGDDDLLKK